jgi:hypothetical protein
MYPNLLKPQNTEEIVLISGRIIQIPKSNPTFSKWSGVQPEDTYGNKTVLDFEGEPVFAELAILRIFQKDGWNGVWVDSYRRRFRKTYWGSETDALLPEEQILLLNDIYKIAGINSGCWDVFSWKKQKVVFAEAKRKGKDKIRENQVRFLEAALSLGLNVDSFLIVEWVFL